MSTSEDIHNRNAPYWAITMVILGTCGLATIWIDLGNFWKGYVLDICGPAWNYILFRGLFTAKADNMWTRTFTPIRTVTTFVLFIYGVELMQYFNIYESTFDPWDLLAYISILIPLFIIDQIQFQKQ